MISPSMSNGLDYEHTAGRNWVYMALRDWKGNDTPGLAFKLSHIQPLAQRYRHRRFCE
jgi:hypothetical protein